MAQRWILAGLVALSLSLAMTACHHDDPGPRTPDWHAQERAPQTADRWWDEPVERRCEQDSECRASERCELMRLGTCESCPRTGGGYVRGQDARICVPRESGAPTAGR